QINKNLLITLAEYVIKTEDDSILGYALSGTLPTGMGFDTTSGVISGTPLQSGTFTLSVSASDDDGTSNIVTFDLIIGTTIPISSFDNITIDGELLQKGSDFVLGYTTENDYVDFTEYFRIYKKPTTKPMAFWDAYYNTSGTLFVRTLKNSDNQGKLAFYRVANYGNGAEGELIAETTSNACPESYSFGEQVVCLGVSIEPGVDYAIKYENSKLLSSDTTASDLPPMSMDFFPDAATRGMEDGIICLNDVANIPEIRNCGETWYRSTYRQVVKPNLDNGRRMAKMKLGDAESAKIAADVGFWALEIGQNVVSNTENIKNFKKLSQANKSKLIATGVNLALQGVGMAADGGTGTWSDSLSIIGDHIVGGIAAADCVATVDLSSCQTAILTLVEDIYSATNEIIWIRSNWDYQRISLSYMTIDIALRQSYLNWYDWNQFVTASNQSSQEIDDILYGYAASYIDWNALDGAWYQELADIELSDFDKAQAAELYLKLMGRISSSPLIDRMHNDNIYKDKDGNGVVNRVDYPERKGMNPALINYLLE
ncbi:MAG: Ig domain-containing protein, partial [Campylobacterota bacterium]|nr:Ig domain-containing protein [Campylobacterota bacterium]